MKLILISHRASTFITQKTREGAKCKHCHPKSIEKVPLPPKFSFHMRQHDRHSLTDSLKLEIGDFACLTVVAPPLSYSIGWEYLSGQSGLSDISGLSGQ